MNSAAHRPIANWPALKATFAVFVLWTMLSGPAFALSASNEPQVLSSTSPAFLDAVASEIKPAPDGTVGENRGEWLGVAEQRQTFRLAAAGIRGKNASLVTRAFLVADAAFAHQEADGGFAYNVARSGLSATPNATGLAAQAAFFVSDLSHTLLLLRDSPWFRASQMTPALRQRIPGLEQHLSSALGYLINHRQDLHADHDTANRFLIYAEAYYLSGKLLGRDDALSVGREFIDQALSQQASDGTFLELHGFDSSYQNVSLSEGEYLFLYMSGDSEQPRLWNAISRGYERELRALAPSGEISTAGNTRVGAQSIPALHGGPVHRFDSEAAGFAFTYFAAIAGTPDAERNADLVVHHYFNV